jgi:hypothetical protein
VKRGFKFKAKHGKNAQRCNTQKCSACWKTLKSIFKTELWSQKTQLCFHRLSYYWSFTWIQVNWIMKLWNYTILNKTNIYLIPLPFNQKVLCHFVSQIVQSVLFNFSITKYGQFSMENLNLSLDSLKRQILMYATEVFYRSVYVKQPSSSRAIFWGMRHMYPKNTTVRFVIAWQLQIVQSYFWISTQHDPGNDQRATFNTIYFHLWWACFLLNRLKIALIFCMHTATYLNSLW